MSENRNTALGLLRKSQEDLQAAKKLAEPPSSSIWVIGFHAQQAVEKAAKAVLIYHGVHYPFTHDIASLIALLQQKNISLPPDHEVLSCLTPFGTQFRYEDEELEPPTSIHTNDILAWTDKVVCWAQSCLK